MTITIPRRKTHHKPLVWRETHDLVVEIAKRWGNLTVVATYHIMAQVASRFETPEQFIALAEALQKADDATG